MSRLTGGTLAVIMAGGRGERLKDLTAHRAKPATPFGGKFRIVDFVLSNCVNSGIRQISILTQYKAQSLIQHVQRGWSYLRGEFGEFVEVIPAQEVRSFDVDLFLKEARRKPALLEELRNALKVGDFGTVSFHQRPLDPDE